MAFGRAFSSSMPTERLPQPTPRASNIVKSCQECRRVGRSDRAFLYAILAYHPGMTTGSQRGI